MPSFFFHLAIDLDHRSYSSPQPFVSESDSLYKTNPAEAPLRKGSDLESSDPQPKEKTVQTLDPTASPSDPCDWRYGKLSTHTINMTPSTATATLAGKPEVGPAVSNGISAGHGGLATKGRYEPCDPQDEDLGWGVVRLYRDAEETPGLYDEPATPRHARASRASTKKEEEEDGKPRFQDGDCTTLCILAVPSYLTPSDFLGFVGEETREEVSHFRMIRTERSNRYMVLMKFRRGKAARAWRRQWNGKAFDGMEVTPTHPLDLRCPPLTYPSPSIAMSSSSSLSNSGRGRRRGKSPPSRTCGTTLSRRRSLRPRRRPHRRRAVLKPPPSARPRAPPSRWHLPPRR